MVDLQRRALIAGAAATVAALRLGATALARRPSGERPLPADPFTLGVASGDPGRGRVRAVDPPGARSAERRRACRPTPVAVTWEVAADARFATIEASGVVNAVADLAHTVHVEVEGLLPDTTYWYRFSVEGWASPVGRAHTLAVGSPDGAALRVRLVPELRQRLLHRPGGAWPPRSATCGCTSATTSTRTPAAARPARTAPTSASPSTSTAPATRSTRPTPTSRRPTTPRPVVPVWDDHEVDNNYRWSTTPGARPGYRAWFEHLPVRLDRADRAEPADLPAARVG